MSYIPTLVYVSHFGPSADQRGFSVTATNHGSNSQVVSVMAECLSAARAHLTVPPPVQQNISPHGSGAIKIACPRGTVLSGGGIDLLNGVAATYEFAPGSATTWQAQVRNQTIVGTTVKLYALCLSFT